MTNVTSIALLGQGRMGSAVRSEAERRGHRVVGVVDSSQPLTRPDAQLAGADVAIDFSHADVAFQHAEACLAMGVPLVMGTTGWASPEERLSSLVNTRGGAVMYAPNFSIGVAIARHATQALGTLLDAFPEFDVAVHESHHSGKLDSPSGTAIHIAQTLLETIDRKRHRHDGSAQGRLAPEALQVTSSRTGHGFGTHCVTVDGPHDLLELRHQAKSRAGFASGAVTAAEWLIARHGFHSLDDMLADRIREASITQAS